MHSRPVLKTPLLLMLAACLAFPPAVPGGSPHSDAMRLAVTRDTWLSSFREERDANLGGEDRLKAKGVVEFSMIDFDPEAIRGRVVTAATLHLHSRSETPLRRVTVSSLASDWVEGNAVRYRSQPGSSSFNWAAQDRQQWAWPGSDVTAVMNGMGHTIWRFADATPPDKGSWQTISVDPSVVAVRVAGLSYGFVVFDDVGSEYLRKGERVLQQPMLNRFFSSRESGPDRAPYFTIQLGPKDLAAPRAVSEITSESEALPAGEARISWVTPEDEGEAETLGFYVRVTSDESFNWTSARPVPRYLIPLAGKTGEPVTLHLRDMDFKSGERVIVGIRAVDGTGNSGPVRTTIVKLAEARSIGTLPDPPVIPAVEKTNRLPGLGGLKFFVVDALDKVDPVTGDMIPPHPAEYRLANHHWSAAKRQVHLFAARNETTAFQLVVTGQTKDLQVTVEFNQEGAVAPVPELFALRYVNGKDGRLFPDPLVPLNAPLRIPSHDSRLARQTHASLIVDIHVPKNARPGLHKGKLNVTSGDDALTIDIVLQVWSFSLPDQLSFIPQMNGYGRVPEEKHELDYYRLAHKHRTCLNILPYSWTGRITDNRAPKWNGQHFDWAAYDHRFGPLLDGSAFADLPRGPVPVEAFYLPLNENWPVSLNDKFLGGYWIENAFTPEYRKQFVTAVGQFAEHIHAKGWDQTVFEFYLNNKMIHKKDNWRASSAPWNFDEPVNTQDFWALRWYGKAFHEGVGRFDKSNKLMFRADISRPQWQRNILDEVLNVNVISNSYRRYLRYVLDRKSRTGEMTYIYGSANPIEQSNLQPVGWSIEAWSHGLDGVIPWQTLGKQRSWTGADRNALFYPGETIGKPGPLPSIRLKAFRRGQQDVEYLNILENVDGMMRSDIKRLVIKRLNQGGDFTQALDEYDEKVNFQDLDPATLWKLRTAIGLRLDENFKTSSGGRLTERAKGIQGKCADIDRPDCPDSYGTLAQLFF